jgi:hypothetical protein
MSTATIDSDLDQALRALGAGQEIEVLVYPPASASGALDAYLEQRQRAGALRYNTLRFAGCSAVKAKREEIERLATRPEVARLAANPRFGAGAP